MRTLWILLISLAGLLAGVYWLLDSSGAEVEAVAEAGESSVKAAPESRPASVAQPALDDDTDRDELAPSEDFLSAEAAAARLNRPTTHLQGRVVDDAGRPVAGVRVLCAAADRGPATPLDSPVWGERHRRRREVFSDEEGRFRFAEAPTGVVRVALRAADHAPRDFDGLIVPEGRETDLGDLVLTLGARLSGFVVDARGGPVAEAWLIRPSDSQRPTLGREPGDRGMLLGRTGAGGEFDLRALPVGPWTLLVHAPEHPDLAAHGSTTSPGEHQRGLVLRMRESAAIRGRISIAPGPNAPRAEELEIHASPHEVTLPRGEAAPSRRVALVAPDGRFRIEGVEPERAYNVRAVLREENGRRGSMGLEASVEARGGDSDVELRIGDVFSVVFTVRDAVSGAALSKLGIQLLAVAADDTVRALAAVETELGDGRMRLTTDRTLRRGELARLSLERSEYQPHRTPTFALEPGKETDLGEIRLAPRPRLVFRVVDAASAEPVEGARVSMEVGPPGGAGAPDSRARGGQRTLRSEPTGRDGIATLHGAPGECGYAVARHVSFASSALTEVCFDGASAVTELLVSRGASLRVWVRSPGGAPLPSRSVQAQRDTRGPGLPPGEALRYFEQQQTTDSEGCATFAGLTPGAYRIALFEPRVGAPRSEREHAATIAFVTLTDGAENEATLIALPRGSLTGRVVSGRRPLANASVILRQADSRFPRAFSGRADSVSVRTDAEGLYRIDDLGAGAWRVDVSHPDFLVSTRLALDYDGDARVFDIEVPRNSVAGRIVDARGDSVEGARIVLGRWQDPSNARDRRSSPFSAFLDGAPAAVTGVDGTFEVLGPPSGQRLALEVQHPGYQRLLTPPFVLQRDAPYLLGELVLEAAGRVDVELDVLPRSGPRPRAVLRRLDGPRGANGEREVRATTLDTRGRATFRSLAPGKWRVELDPRVQGAERPRRDVEVKAERTETVRFDAL